MVAKNSVYCNKSIHYLILGLLAILVSACAPMQLPPITQEPTGLSRPGKVVWHDLVTDDVAAAKEFYGKLLGWSFEQHGKYTLVINDNKPIGGMVKFGDSGTDRKSAGWIPYFSMPDVDDTAKWILSMGGRILDGPGNMTGRGRYATVADPLETPLVILHSSSGDPAPTEARVGEWFWDELWTTDVEAALSFYQNLEGYAAQRVSTEEDETYWVLLDENDRETVGITEVPFEELLSQWVPALKVTNLAELAQRVSLLGGEVIIPPDHPLSDGRVALVRDPTGGIFMMDVWLPENEILEQ